MNDYEVVHCLNGPCEGAAVDVPPEAVPGAACALRWRTIQGADRFAVYVLVDYLAHRGLMYLRSYDKPARAEQKVDQLTAVCTAALN